MRPRISHTTRQAALAALTANAIRPLDTPRTAVGAFVAGWLTGELTPQLLALGLADTAVAVRRGRATRKGVALSLASAAGLTWLIRHSTRAGAIVETSLGGTIGEAYEELINADPDDAKMPLSAIARPFRLRDPRVEVLRDIHYTEGGVKSLLDIYRPRDVDLEKAPVLIQIHGGAWVIGKKEEQALILMNRMATRGWVCVAVNYRLAPKYRWPTQIVDVKRAVAWVREHIAEYGGDPDYLVLTGGSAGGHLCSLAALTPGKFQPGFEDADTSVAACVPFYGVYDMVGDDGDRFTVGMRRDLLAKKVFQPGAPLQEFRDASPLHQVTEDAPDFFAIHGVNDTLVSVRQARRFVSRLREISRASTTYAELPSTQHAFEVFSSIRSQQVIRGVQRWLEWHRARWLAQQAAAPADQEQCANA